MTTAIEAYADLAKVRPLLGKNRHRSSRRMVENGPKHILWDRARRPNHHSAPPDARSGLVAGELSLRKP
jgi:hypothetical protein